jgi:hypothetical protein
MHSILGIQDTYLAFISLVRIAPASEVSGEQRLRNILLRDSIVDWGLLRLRRDGVDGAECETKKSAAVTLRASVSNFSRTVLERLRHTC